MIEKTQIREYQNMLSLMKTCGKRLFFGTNSGSESFQKSTDLFVNEYKEIFPGECELLRIYASKVTQHKNFSSDDIVFLYYITTLIDREFDKKVKPPKIFISHCEKDIAIVEKFVDLLSHIGISTNQLLKLPTPIRCVEP